LTDDAAAGAAPVRRPGAADHGVFAVASVATLALDQLTKQLVIDWLAPGERWPAADAAISRFFTFTHVHNTGMAFGLGQGRSELFALVATVIVLGLMVYQARLPLGARWLRLALGLQAGGAIGNLVDRLRHGHVTDFFDFQVWPVFNVADSAIFIGVAILAWHLWRPEGPAEGAGAADADAGHGVVPDAGHGATPDTAPPGASGA